MMYIFIYINIYIHKIYVKHDSCLHQISKYEIFYIYENN